MGLFREIRSHVRLGRCDHAVIQPDDTNNFINEMKAAVEQTA